MKKIGYIYGIENTLNSDIYIGSTTKSIEIRFKQHVHESQKKYPKAFHTFMKKLGPEHFRITLLKKVEYENLSELLIEEDKFIKSYGTLNIKNNFSYCKELKILNCEKILRFGEFVRIFFNEIIYKIIYSSYNTIVIDKNFLKHLGFKGKNNIIIFSILLIKNRYDFSIENTKIIMKLIDFLELTNFSISILEEILFVYIEYLSLKLNHNNL